MGLPGSSEDLAENLDLFETMCKILNVPMEVKKYGQEDD